MQNATGPIILIGLVVLGMALFWARHLAYRHRPVAAEDVAKLMLSIGAWVCIFVGLGGGVLHGLAYLSPIGLVIVIAVAIMLVTRYRALERRSMLRCISIAAQKGIPLNEATRAFANERSDELGLRAIRLAEGIESGVPLPLALARSGTRLPEDSLLAVRVGYETGTLSESLRRVSRVDNDMDLLIRSVYEKLLYIMWVWMALFCVTSFVILKIVPVFERMFLEFGVRLPVVTLVLLHATTIFARYWYLGLPLFLIAVAACCCGTLYYVNLLPRGLPIVHRFSRPWDAALVMRVLALAVRNNWPMNKSIWLLARVFPSGPVRSRLARAGREMDNGTEWCQSLRRSGLIRRSESAVLAAAARVGNLEWALDEMADSSLRRLVFRLRLAVNVIFPLTLFVFGLLVGGVVIGLFAPLVTLIQGMT